MAGDEKQLYIAPNGLRQPIGPDDPETRARYEALIAADYAQCHPGVTLENLKQRARFPKECKELRRDWMEVVARRMAASAPEA